MGENLQGTEPVSADRVRGASWAPRLHVLLARVCAVIALVVLAVLAVRAAVRLELRWDTFWYHLPFAALRGGVVMPYDMNDLVRFRYQGFPPLPHLLQGLLWRLTGSVNGTGVVNYIAFAGFLAYSHKALRAPFWLVALIALAAPLVVIHATTSYVDLFGNSLLAIGLCSCLSLHLFPERSPRRVLLCGLLGLAGAAWSKFLLLPVVVVSWGAMALVAFGRRPATGFSRKGTAMILLAAAVIIALPYLKNLVVYGNPFWPVRVPLLGEMLPYREDPTPGMPQQRPPMMLDYAQPRLFLHSLLEIGHPDHYDHRPRWIIDQGNAWVAFRMGGFWGKGVVVFLALLLASLIAHDRRAAAKVGLGIGGLLCFVAFLPQSHELRYSLFIPLCWAAGIGMLFPAISAAYPRASLLVPGIALVLFGYMAHENRPHYDVAKVGWQESAASWGVTPMWKKLRPGVSYCAVDMIPLGILLTGPTGSEYSIVDRSTRELCPPDSVVVTAGDMNSPYLGASALQRSLESFHRGDYAGSIRAAQEALRADPANTAAHNNVCISQVMLGRFDEGARACEEALAIDSGHGLARNNLAFARRLEAEAAPLLQALRDGPSADEYRALSAFYSREGLHAKALEAARAAADAEQRAGAP